MVPLGVERVRLVGAVRMIGAAFCANRRCSPCAGALPPCFARAPRAASQSGAVMPKASVESTVATAPISASSARWRCAKIGALSARMGEVECDERRRGGRQQQRVPADDSQDRSATRPRRTTPRPCHSSARCAETGTATMTKIVSGVPKATRDVMRVSTGEGRALRWPDPNRTDSNTPCNVAHARLPTLAQAHGCGSRIALLCAA
jgi:hypothetical protein